VPIEAMQHQKTKIILILIFFVNLLCAQVTETDRLIAAELNMTYPSIYFINTSTEYAAMPYTVDSCFKYIAKNSKDIKSIVIWRDSSETETLTKSRIKKLKANLNNYTPSAKITIRSMGKAQKISRRSINEAATHQQIQYLLSLNSVLDVSTTRFAKEVKLKKKKRTHSFPRLVWCGWKSGFHWSTTSTTKKKS